MVGPDIIDAATVALDPKANERERDDANRKFHDWQRAQAATTLEIIEEKSPQDEKSRLPIQIGRKYFHSWKDTEKLYAEVTSWRHFDPRDIAPADTPPPATQAAFEEVFADLIRERGALLRLHPLYKRWTIFVKEPTDEGMQYLAAIMVCEPGEYGQVPLDLENSLDPRLYPVIRNLGIGAYKVPDKGDFEHLRYALADRRMHGGTSRSRAKHFALEEQQSLDEGHASFYDFIDDFVEYNGDLMVRDINRKHGSMQGLPFVPQTSLDEFERLHPTHETVPATDEDGKYLGFSHRRALKPFERGDFLGPHQKRMIATIAFKDYWKAAVAKAELDSKSEDPAVAREARFNLTKLQFLDPSLTQAEMQEMVEEANKAMPGMVDALFNQKGPWAQYQAEVDELEKRVENTIKLQSIQESNEWRRSLGLPLRDIPAELVPDGALDTEPTPIPTPEVQEERVWPSRELQPLRSRN